MNVTSSKISYGDPVDLAAGAAYLKSLMTTLAGVTADFPGTVNLIVGNPGANPAQIYFTSSNKDALAVTGIPVAVGQTLVFADLDPATILNYKSTAGTTLTVQAGKSNG